MTTLHPFIDPNTPRVDDVIRDLGDANAEFAAAQTGVGVFDLSHRDRLVFAGADCAPFLNRLLTYDITTMNPGDGARPFLLDARGRIRATFNLLCVATDEFWVDTAPGTGDALCAALDMYHFGERFEMSPQTGQTAFSVQGAQAYELLGRLGWRVPSAPWRHTTVDTDAGQIRIARIDRARGPGYDVYMAPEAVPALLKTVVDAGAVAGGADALEMLRVEAGRADSPAEFGSHSSPLELDALDGLTDGKGCYPGQEVIERTICLGKPPRKLVSVAVEQAATPGTHLTDGDRNVGTLTSVVRLPDGQWVALALIKRRSAEADTWTYGTGWARRR